MAKYLLDMVGRPEEEMNQVIVQLKRYDAYNFNIPLGRPGIIILDWYDQKPISEVLSPFNCSFRQIS